MPKSYVVGPDDLKDAAKEMLGPDATLGPQRVTDEDSIRVALRIGICRAALFVAILALVVFLVVGAIRGSFVWWAIGALAIVAGFAWAMKRYYAERLSHLERDRL